MSLVDKDGKLFGKINVVDTIVVIIVVLGIAAGAYLLFSSPKVTPTNSSGEKEYVDVTLAGDLPIDQDVTIKEGDHLRTFGGRYDWGEVTKVETTSQPVLLSDGKGGTITADSVTGKLITVVVRVPGVYQNELGFFNGETHIQVGNTFSFETPDFMFSGRVFKMDKVAK